MPRTDFFRQLAHSIREARAAQQLAREERTDEVRALQARLDRLRQWEQLRPPCERRSEA